jgi:transposase
MNELSVHEKETVLALLRLGWSVRRVARETKHRRETIDRYGRAAGLIAPKPSTGSKVPTGSGADLGAEPAAPSADDNRDAAVAEQSPTIVLADSTAVPAPAKISRSSCEPHRTFIVAELNKRRNMLSIHQDLVEHVGFTGSYDAVKRFARLVTPSSEPHVFCRYESELAAEAQVDYGEGAPTRHPQNGKYLKPRLFVMTLGASRKSFEKTVWKSSQQVWAELHEEAFAHFGGAPKLVRLDGLKEGVIKPDIYDPELNQLYAAVMAYYGTAALPCRPYAPNLKGKVERTIDYVQDSALKGRRFECIEDQNAFLLHWDERVASTRIHGTTKRQVRKAFEEERPFLLALPPRRFEYYKIHERRVHFDGHIEVGGAYSAAVMGEPGSIRLVSSLGLMPNPAGRATQPLFNVVKLAIQYASGVPAPARPLNYS